MRKLNFAKIDFIRAGNYRWTVLLFPFFAGIILLTTDEGNSLFSVFYALFGAIIFASQPFCMEKRVNSGFIHMLPAKDGDEIAGHYLYSLFLALYDLLAALLLCLFCSLLRPMTVPDPAVCLLIFSLALLVIALQNLVLSQVPPERSAQAMAILRMVPAFGFYFGLLSFSNVYEKNPAIFSNLTDLITLPNCLILFFAVLVLFFLFQNLSIRLSAKKDAA